MENKLILNPLPSLSKILPLPEDSSRPLWSVMMPTYNPPEFIYEALSSVLAQCPDPDKMQIEVVDDCSTKVDVEKIVQEAGNGRIKFYRQSKNLGHSFNFTECIRRARGELVHILHSDDIVKSGFYNTFEKIFDQYKNIGAAYCRQEYINDDGNTLFLSDLDRNETGILDNAVIRLAEMQRVQYCAMVVKRKTYEQTGGFIMKNIGGEDWEMWVRIASQFPIAYEPEALAKYRIHKASMTSGDMRTGEDIRSLQEAINIFNNYLPVEKRSKVKLSTRKYYADYSLRNATRMFKEFNDEQGAAAQLTETIKLDSELIHSKLDLLNEFKIPIEGAGVSVAICCQNDEELISKTLSNLTNQKVPEYIPWEIILVDSNSTDHTIELAVKTWKKYRTNVPLRIIRINPYNFSEARAAGINNSRYNFIIFCNPGDLLKENYIKMVSENMMGDSEIGVIGGYAEPVLKGEPPKWYKELGNNSFQTGEPYDLPGPVTWSKGFVWSSGMAIRKEAWNSILEKNFKSVFGKTLDRISGTGSDKELCYALRLNGWSIVYDMYLKLNKFIPASDLKWSHLRNIRKQYGTNSVALYPYTHYNKHELDDYRKLPSKKNQRLLIRRAYRELKNFSAWKLKAYRENLFGDRDLLKIEYSFAKLRTLLNEIKSYNRKIRLLKKIVRKKDFKFLRYVVTRPYFRFPQYKNQNDKRGVSVIFNYNNSSYNLLLRSLEKISQQQLPEEFPWEVILISNFIKDDIKKEIYRRWDNSGCTATLKIEERNISNSGVLRNIATEKSKYDYLIFLNEYDLVYPDYIRIAYKCIHKNKAAGIIGGQTMLASDVNPPKWFGNYKELFAVGKQAKESGDITLTRGYLWSTGIVARKKAIQEISDKKYDIIGTDDKGSVILNSDHELSGKIRLSGWKIFYEERLRLKHYIPVNKFNWEYLRALYYTKGSEEVKTSAYSELLELNKSDTHENKPGWIFNAGRVINEIRKYPFRKIFSKEREFKADTEVLEIEKLQGRFKEILRVKNKYHDSANRIKQSLNGNGFSGIKLSSNGISGVNKNRNGVSVVICCYNSSKVLPRTLKNIFTQNVPDNIPWEIIIVDNASKDNTSGVAEDTFNSYNCLASFKVVKENTPGLSSARLKGFNTAKYEYIIFSDDDNLLDKDFVKTAYAIMNGNDKIGVLGGMSKGEFNEPPPEWFKDWKNSFAIGKQSDAAGDITWTRGYVWGASMVVRKEAWKNLIEKGFKSKLTDRLGSIVSSGGDTEICYALRNLGWKIWYEPELKFKHYISADRINWKYLRKLFRGFGQASPGLDFYVRSLRGEIKQNNNFSIPGSERMELHRTLSILRKTRYKKLLTYDRLRESDSDIPMIEYCLGRIEGFIKSKKNYNKGLRTLKKTARKKDLKYLSSVFKKTNRSFPRYKITGKLNGVSVIVCTYNGEERLADTVRHIALQKVDPRLLWELILVDNASTDNTKNSVIEEWKKHKSSARLKIVDEYEQGLSAARQKGFDSAGYEYLVLCDDDNWLDENFVQTAYDIMSNTKDIGVLGGPNEALCELDPPGWFKWFQHGYAAGVQSDLSCGKVSEGNITWKRGFVWGAGMIIRRTALKDLYSKGFTSLMSDRKGYQLSSGGDSELCYALVLSGWQIWYDAGLKLKHCMPAGRVTWNYLIRLFQGFGITSVGLDYYEKAIKLGRNDFIPEEIKKQNWKYEYKKAYKEVRKYGIRKLLGLRFSQENNTKIPMLEYYLARLIELRRVKNVYDINLETIANAVWKKSSSGLKSRHRNFVEKENDFRYGWPWNGQPGGQAKDTNITPKISILSPSFNSENTVEKAILSVLNQGYADFEHIICDGGSTDGTVEILKKYPHLKWVSEKDSGQCDAMNKAFEMASGEIISYLNVDDYYQRGVFRKIAKAFSENPGAEMVVGNLYFEYDDHTFVRKPEVDYKKIMLPFRYIFPINPVSYFYKKDVQTKAGKFPADDHYTMDYWFLLKAFQNHKVVKIEDYLGTFCMNGFNKTSGADNRKNTHYRVLDHCLKHDRKNLPYYLYNYYKHYYFEKKVFFIKKFFHRSKKNLERLYSVLTLKKNKYYAEKLFQSARQNYYLNKRYKVVSGIFSSFAIYPKGIVQRSRQSLLIQSALGQKYFEKSKTAYFFFTTPPGLPLANKIHYYADEYRKKNKTVKGNSLLLLTYIISPKFIFRNKRNYSGYRKIRQKFSIRRMLHLLNPVTWIKGPVSFFRNKEYKELSYNYFVRAGEKYYFHWNIQATILMILSFLSYPVSFKKKSRMNLFAYSFLGNTFIEKIKFTYHLYKDNPELSFAHKVNFYGNELRKENHGLKGNSILLVAYVLSPKYIFKREKIVKSNIVFVSSDIKISKNISSINRPRSLTKSSFDPSASLYKIKYLLNHPGESFGKRIKNLFLVLQFRIKSVYFYFRYRKFKARSKELYLEAIESYKKNERFKVIMKLILSYFLYPVSIFNRNKLSLMINTLTGRSLKQKQNSER